MTVSQRSLQDAPYCDRRNDCQARARNHEMPQGICRLVEVELDQAVEDHQPGWPSRTDPVTQTRPGRKQVQLPIEQHQQEQRNRECWRGAERIHDYSQGSGTCAGGCGPCSKDHGHEQHDHACPKGQLKSCRSELGDVLDHRPARTQRSAEIADDSMFSGTSRTARVWAGHSPVRAALFRPRPQERSRRPSPELDRRAESRGS